MIYLLLSYLVLRFHLRYHMLMIILCKLVNAHDVNSSASTPNQGRRARGAGIPERIHLWAMTHTRTDSHHGRNFYAVPSSSL